MPAHADPAADVEALLKKGTALRRQGRDREALAEFQRAASIRETPHVQAQIGLAHQALGSWVDANAYLTRALDHRDDPWVERNRATLEGARSTIRTHLAQVEVWGAPNEAEVQLDAVSVGKLPSVVTWVATGDVSLRVSAPGYASVNRTLTVLPAARMREHVDLHLLPPVPKLAELDSGGGTKVTALSGPGEVDSAGAASGAGRPNADGASPADSARAPLYRQWWFWTAVGVVAIGAGVGVYFLTRGSSGCSPPACDLLN